MTAFLYPPPAIEQPVIIRNDGGGVVVDYEAQLAIYKVQNRRIEIRGSCRSACTLALAAPNVCVGPGAEVKWHHAFQPTGHIVRDDVTERMLSQLPSKIQNRIRGNVTVDYNPNATLNYRQLVELGIKSCDAPTTTVVAKVETFPAPTVVSTPVAPENQPVADSEQEAFNRYFQTVYKWSEAQNHGKAAYVIRGNAKVLGYYDRKGQYVEVFENIKTGEKSVCRLTNPGLLEDTYTCTDWVTEKTELYNTTRDPLF
jgi:hypothetical protein